MGVSAELNRRGLALPTALLGLVVVSVLAAAIYSVSDVAGHAAQNRVASARAMLVAEQGAAHAVRLLQDSLQHVSYTNLLRGSDNTASTTDDGRLTGYSLNSAVQIPVAGKAGVGGTYKVQLLDDPADPDGVNLVDKNYRVLVRCTATTTEGAGAAVDLIIYGPPSPAIAVGGDLKISGKPSITGKCGGLQANGSIEVGAEPTIVSGYLAAAGTVGPKPITYPSGTTNSPTTGVPAIPIPDLNPLDYCATADYVAQADGKVKRMSDGTLHTATSTAKFGFKQTSGSSPIKWDFDVATAVEATFCVYGNVYFPSAPGTSSNPLNISLYVTGSVQISGDPYLAPAPGDSVIVMSGGDVELNGSPASGSSNYEGLIYAESQCKVSGTPNVSGQFWCLNKTNAAGTVELASQNEISGDAKFVYNCGGAATKWRRQVYWAQPTP